MTNINAADAKRTENRRITLECLLKEEEDVKASIELSRSKILMRNKMLNHGKQMN